MLSIAKLYPTRQWFRTYPLIGNVRSSRWTDPMLKAEFEELIQQILKNHPDLTREEAEMLVLTGGGVRPRAVYEPTPELRGRRESRGVTPLTWHELDSETGVSPRHRALPRRETGEIFRSEANPARASASHRGRGII